VPRVAPDTIYALAVDSAKYPRESFIYLLDDGVLRYEADGRGSRTYRQVIQILKQDAVERWAEFSFSYEPRHERLTVNWAKVVKPDGTVVSDKPGIAQDADVPAPMDDPVYVEQKVRRLSLSNVRPGTLVDYSYTIEELKPFRAGDFFAPWRVNPGTLVRRSRLLIDTPVSLVPRVVERNLNFRPTTVTANGRRIVTWATQEVPKIEPEPFASDSNGVDMRVDVGAPARWGEIGAWYAGLARDRYTMTPALERKLAGLVAGARTLEDSIRAVHRYVTRDVRYVAISLQMGGYQPHAAADVVATGYGDCKDKATLFITFMKRMGITAYPVLLSAGGAVERQLPTIAQFNHAIAAVERPGGAGRLFVDLTAADVPWGSLPEADQGQFVLVIRPDGRTEETTTPENDRTEIHNRLAVTGVLDTTGAASAHVEMTMSGGVGEAYHSAITSSPPDSASLAQYLRRMASGVWPESEGDSLGFTDETEKGGAFRIHFVARRGRAAQLAGPVAILSVPFLKQQSDVKPLVAELQAHRPRRFPIDVGEVSAAFGGNGEAELKLELPVGWRVELPRDVDLSGPFGEMKLHYAQNGRVFSVSQRRVGRKGVLPPERLDDLIAWLEQVAAATRESGSIVVKR
jgi:transglutaminase-like putative cysteine protease